MIGYDMPLELFWEKTSVAWGVHIYFSDFISQAPSVHWVLGGDRRPNCGESTKLARMLHHEFKELASKDRFLSSNRVYLCKSGI
jgi:hypothetical protein